jgi:hypothetical protein
MDLAKSLGDRETVTAVELLEIDRRQQQESARLAKSGIYFLFQAIVVVTGFDWC